MTEEHLFEQALQARPEDRVALLDRECAGNLELRARIDALLAADAKPNLTIDSPVNPTQSFNVTGGEPGAVIAGRYTLVELIGEGGMGEVWVAKQSEPVKRKVALKLIKAGMGTKAVLHRFEAERQALALMDHPNIAKVLDGGMTAERRPFFVMELVNGLNLTKFCDEAKLGIRERLELFVAVCQALQHAHQKGIIHRDLKPSNILVTMLDGRPIPKIIDFGVAKAVGGRLTDESLSTQFGGVVGTLAYMSPEQAGYSAADVDTRADIYSLGVILYELLTGLKPIDANRLRQAALTELIRIIREEEPSKPSTRLSTDESAPSLAALRHTEPKKLAALLRGELDWIVMKCLDKQRDRRYETANGLARDIQRFLADEPVEARPPSAGYRLSKFFKRNKGQVVAASLVLLTLIGGMIGTTWGMFRANEQRELAQASEREALAERDAKDKALAAETKARAAEKQARDKALAALRMMTDDVVENQMARGANLSEENKEFLRKIITHFEGFASITADDAESRSIRAEGFQRVGGMRFRLGDLREAEAADVQALALRKQLAADFPTHPEARRELAASQNDLGFLLYSMGRLPEAETAYTDALALLKQLASDFPNRPEFRQDLASCWNNLGILFHTNDRLKEAEAAFADALALQKQLAAAVPTTRRLRIDLSRSHNNLGNLLRVTGRPKEAEAAYADALALEKQLVADFPNRPEFRQLLASSHSNLGGVFLVTDRPKEAEAAVLAALAQFKQLAAEFPTRPDFGLGLANCHNCLGLLFYADRRLNEAEAAFANAIAIEEQLVADFAARTDFRVLLADSYTKAGLVFSDKGQQKDSDVALATAIALEKQLVADFPNQPMRQTNLLRAYRNLIYLRLEWREFKAAKTLLDEAMPYHETILKANPLDPDVRRLYQSNLQEMIQAHAGLGDVVEAKQTAVKLRDLGWDPPGNSYAAACGLSLCVPIVQKDDKTAKDVRDKQVRYYADEAMLMLTEAVAKGYKDATSLKEELDLKPLRDREDFKRLVAELEKKAVIP